MQRNGGENRKKAVLYYSMDIDIVYNRIALCYESLKDCKGDQKKQQVKVLFNQNHVL